MDKAQMEEQKRGDFKSLYEYCKNEMEQSLNMLIKYREDNLLTQKAASKLFDVSIAFISKNEQKNNENLPSHLKQRIIYLKMLDFMFEKLINTQLDLRTLHRYADSQIYNLSKEDIKKWIDLHTTSTVKSSGFKHKKRGSEDV